MRYNTYINNQKCKEWGLNANQGALFDLLNQVHSWAKEIIIDGKVYYHISRNKVIEEISLFYSKPDTVYRHFKILEEKNLIEYTKVGKQDLIRLTEIGKTWNEIRNSEINPTKFGNESEKYSEMNPTYNNTREHNITNNNKEDKSSKKEVVTNESLKTWWNELATANGLPTLRLFNNSRKQHLMTRVKEIGSLEELQKQVKYHIEHSTFLKGYNDREWKADFDWVVNPTNFAKLIEGKYLSQDLKQKTEEQNKPKTDWSQYDKYF